MRNSVVVCSQSSAGLGSLTGALEAMMEPASLPHDPALPQDVLQAGSGGMVSAEPLLDFWEEIRVFGEEEPDLDFTDRP